MGILDSALQAPDSTFDPQTQGILKAAFALMAASGATRTPTGFGEALGQAGGAGIDAFEKAKAQQSSELQKRLQTAKLASDLKIQQELEGSGILNSTDPDRLEAVGTSLAMRGHPGGAALINSAEKIRASQQKEKRLGAMRTAVQPDPQEVGQAADLGTPAPTGGGIFAPLMSSPYVGDDAKRLQAQLDREGKGANPDDYLKRLDALATAHRTAAEKEAAKVDKRIEKEDFEPLVAVMKNGKPTLVKRSQAEGMTPATAGAIGDAIPSQHKDLHGDYYLSTLPTGMSQLVRSIAEGKVDPSKAASLRFGNREALMQRVQQYDPTYNQARSKVYADFTTGKAANNVTAMNTVTAHMGTVLELAEAQKNGNIQTINAVLNRARTEFGDPSINNTSIAVQAMGNELMRVFRQVSASQTEVEAWEKKFNAAKGSPEQLRGALKVGAELLKGRLDAMQDQWDRGMGNEERKAAGLSSIDFPLLSDKSKQALAKMGVVGKGIPLSSESAPSAAPAKAARKYNPATGRLE